jgi:hypothetical protein
LIDYDDELRLHDERLQARLASSVATGSEGDDSGHA